MAKDESEPKQTRRNLNSNVFPSSCEERLRDLDGSAWRREKTRL